MHLCQVRASRGSSLEIYFSMVKRRRSDARPILLGLPSELLQFVFGLLGIAEFSRWLRPVCRQTHAFILKCNSVCLPDHGLNAWQIKSLLRGLHLSSLVSLGLCLVTKLPELDAGCLPILDALAISSRDIYSSCLKNVLCAAPQIRVLKLECSYLSPDALQYVGRLHRLRCLWWPRAMHQGLHHLSAGQLTEFGISGLLNEDHQEWFSTSGMVFSKVRTVTMTALFPPGLLAGVVAVMPKLRVLRVGSLLFGRTLAAVDGWARRLFVVCPSLLQVQVLSTYADHEIFKVKGLKIWVRESPERVQFYAEYEPVTTSMPELVSICKPLTKKLAKELTSEEENSE